MRKVALFIPALIVAAVVAAPNIAARTTASSHSAARESITVIIPFEPGQAVWVAGINGIKDAARELGVNVTTQWGNNDPVKTNNLIATAVAKHTQGLAVVIPDNNEFTKAICNASHQGIPVIAFNQDATAGPVLNCIKAYIGQDDISEGALLGNYLIKAWGIKKGDVLFAPAEEPTFTYAVNRSGGVRKALNKVGAKLELLRTSDNLSDALTKEVQYLLGHRNIKGIIALGGIPHQVAPQAIAEVKRKIPIAGYDMNAPVIKAINSDIDTAAVDQQVYYQTYLSVLELTKYIRYGLNPVSVNSSGNGFVDKSNIAAVVKYPGYH
jgi:simple sugar transport system substrate-binding protein